MLEEAMAIYSLRQGRNGNIQPPMICFPVPLRRADLSDLESLMRIEEDCFGSERFAPEVVRAFLVRDDTFVIVADEGGEIVGSAMCMISHEMSEGKIASIAVLRKARGMGMGSALLEECEKGFREHGLKRYTLETEVTNEPAISLYVSSGYEIKGLVIGLYGTGRDGYAMEKRAGPKGTKVDVRSA